MAEPGLIDFSLLGRLPDAYAKGEERAQQRAFEDSLKGFTGDYNDLVRRAAQAGSMPGLELASKLKQAEAMSQYHLGTLAATREHNRATEDIARQGLVGKPVEHVIEDANGNKRLVRTDPQTNVSVDITPPSLSNAQPSNPFATGGKRTEHEDKSAMFADRAATSHQVINKFEQLNQQPGGTIGSLAERFLPETAANVVVSSERGQLMNAKRGFVNALLRRESGAAINAGEFASYDKEYFPQIGDSPAQLEFKRKHRAEVVAGLAREAGRGYSPGFTIDPVSGHITKTTPIPAAVGRGQPGPATTAAPVQYDHPAIGEARQLIGEGRLTRANAEKKLRENNIPFKPGDLDLQ